MQTYAKHAADGDRYSGAHHDPATKEGARLILSSHYGKRAAKISIADLWKQSHEMGGGWLPTARIGAPLHVLVALETVGVTERANDDRGRAIRFRLTDAGLDAVLAARARG